MAHQETSSRKVWWSRFIMGLNNLMNPGHAWRDYENDPDAYGTLDRALGAVSDVLDNLSTAGDSLANRITQDKPTGAEQAQMDFSANEAQKSRDFTEYMTRNKYQMETQSMEQAGLNPAMVYGGGQLVPTATNSAQGQPQASGTSALNPFDIVMTMMRMRREFGLLDAQIENTKKDTELKGSQAEQNRAQTEFTKIQKEYFPKVTDADIQRIESETGLNRETMNLRKQETLNERAKTAISESESRFADQFNEARVALEKARAGNQNSQAELNSINSAIANIEKIYMDKYGMKMGSSETFSVVMAVLQLFGISGTDLASKIKEGVSKVGDTIKRAFEDGSGNPVVLSEDRR